MIGTVGISLIHSCASLIDDEAFGYKSHITPAVYRAWLRFLHFDIQSTGQKSALRQHRSPAIAMLCLIKQSVPCPFSSKSAVSRLPTRTAARVALAAPVHGPTLRGPASNGVPPAAPRGDWRRSPLPPATSRPAERSPTDPALEPILSQVTDPFCRLPLLHCSID